jgi:hypothetical protein
VVAWSVMLASVSVLTSVFQAPAGSALDGPQPRRQPPVRLSAATPAFASEDDLRARLVADGPDATCELIVGQPLYAGQNTWVPQAAWRCPDRQP